MMWNYGQPGSWGYGGWGMGLSMILMVVFWVAVIVGVVLLIRWLVEGAGGGKTHGGGRETPLEILKKRYAAGEIDKKEYEEKKKELM